MRDQFDRPSGPEPRSRPSGPEPGRTAPPLLSGVGVGPGDPELMTVKAVRVLREADAVIVPVMLGAQEGSGPGRAEATVLTCVPADRIIRVPFAMSDRDGVTPRREQAWDEAARTILERFDAGARSIAFATIGDPNVYSTFHYLAQTVRAARADLRVETVPGITAMQDLAARSGTVLSEGREPLTLMPLTAGIEAYQQALAGPGTVVAYKGWRQTDGIRQALAAAGRLDTAVVGAALGLPEEQICPVADVEGDLPYLSTVLAPARLGRRGGKL